MYDTHIILYLRRYIHMQSHKFSREFLCKTYIYADIEMWYNVIKNGKCEGGFMPTTKASQKAVNKYMKENYERINLVVPKGKKEIIKEHAEKNSESVNAFINRAIDSTMGKDSGNEAQG